LIIAELEPLLGLAEAPEKLERLRRLKAELENSA